MKTKITGKLWIGALAVLTMAITSCKKHDKDLPALPLVTSLDGKKGMDTLTVGNTITLHPVLNTHEGVTYSWTINGVEKGRDTTFVYKADTRGDFVITLKTSNISGFTTADYHLHVFAKYENGFFIANEGWFGHGTGSLSFYRYDTGTKEDSLTTKENPGLDLNPASSTVEFATIFNDKLYLLTKVHGPLVAMDAYTLKETGRIPAASTSDWRAFVGIDNTHALISSQTGIYPLDLNTLVVGTKLASVSGQIGDMIKAGNYIFVLSATQGVVILNAADYSVAKTISGMVAAFAKTPDGAVWAAGGTSLVKIDPATLNTTTTTVPFTVTSQWAAWHPGSITASTKENAVFLAKNGSFTGATSIYKYIDGNAASVQNAFITIASGFETYGAGVSYNPNTNQLVVNTVKSGFGTNYAINDLDFYNATTGSLIKDVPFSGYYFPATYVYH